MVYCFDLWVKKVREKGHKICGQFHDEIISPTLKDKTESKKHDLLMAIREVNKILNLNVELGISIDFGDAYSEIH